MNLNILNPLKVFDAASALHAFAGWSKGYGLGFVASGENCSAQFYGLSMIVTSICCPCITAPIKTEVELVLQIFANMAVNQVVSRGGEALHNKIHSLFTYRFMSSENLTRVIAVATGIAIAVLSNPYYGAGILSSVSYEIADSYGLIPRKISLLAETYLGPLANGSIPILDSLFIGRVVGFSYLGCALVPGLRPFIQHFVDGRMIPVQHYMDGRMIPLQETKLEEYEAPLQDNKKMSHENIAKLLTGQAADFSIDPAHCSKMVSDSAVLLKDQDFTKLLNCFNQITDTPTYESLIKDESFSSSLCKKFPEENQRPSNDDLRAWMSQELDTLVKTLRGDLFYRIKGRQSELQDAIDNVAKIIPLLESMKKEEKIDCFLKLLGGREGAHELKKATSNVLNNLLKKPLYAQKESNDVRCERIIRATFQEERFKIFQKYSTLLPNQKLSGEQFPEHDAEELRKELGSQIPIMQQVKDLARSIVPLNLSLSFNESLSLGFLPRTRLERENVSILETIASSKVLATVRRWMLEEYRNGLRLTMEAAIKNIDGQKGDDLLVEYATRIITSNDRCNSEEMQNLKEIISKPENKQHVKHFVLVCLGILKEKSLSNDLGVKKEGI